MTGLRLGFSVKRQDDLISPLHFTDDETEAQRWKVVKAVPPAGLESSSFQLPGQQAPPLCLA